MRRFARTSGEAVRKNLYGGLRQHHGADIPAVHDDVVLLGDLPLHVQQHIPDNGVSGDQRLAFWEISGVRMSPVTSMPFMIMC